MQMKMKKYIFIAVAGILALSACSKIDDTQNAPRQMTFTAGYNEGGVTRATMNFSTKKVSFDANDEISILSANNTNTKFTTSAGGASATFSGTAMADTKFYAVYPYTAGLTLSGDVISGVVIPTSQWNALWCDWDANSGWDPKAPIAYATTTGASLQFHNLCAILKIKDGKGTFAYTITISADQNLAGTFSLDTSTTPATLTATAGSKTVTISGSPAIRPYGDYLYIAIAPGSYTNFKVRAAAMIGTPVERTKASVSFEAGKIYDLGTFKVD